MNNKAWCISLLAFALFPYQVFAEGPLTLESSIEIALKNSIVLDIAREGTKGATAQKREALTGFLPKFSTSYNYIRLNEDPYTKFLGLPPPLSALNGTEIPVGTKNNFTWSIEAKQPLFSGGGILANYQASKIGEDAALLEQTARYQDVVQEVKIAYFDILRAQKIQETARCDCICQFGRKALGAG